MTKSTQATTIEITDEQIEALRDEAGQAGDLEQVSLCREALNGDEQARKACEQAIRNGQG